jgi:hypothetical protein
MIEMQNAHKLPSRPELAVFIEKLGRSANYEYRFEDKR